MRVQSKNDFVAGLCVSGFGIFVFYEASDLPYLSEYGPGPGLLPLWLGMGFVSLAAVLVANTLLNRGSLEKVAWRKVRRPAAAWSGFVITIGLLSRLGFTLSFALLSLFLVLVMERRSILTAINVAVSLTLAFYLIFVFSLGVPLPLGPWGF